MSRSRVDLPEPDGPTKLTNVPGRTDRLTSSMRQWGAVIEEGMRHIEHVNRTGGGSIRLTGHRLI